MAKVNNRPSLGTLGAPMMGSGLPNVMGWSSFTDEQERVPELQWPNSLDTYRIMRNDAQINALMQGLMLPLRQFRWVIDPNGTPASIHRPIAEDLNLPVHGDDPKRSRERTKSNFSHDDFLRHALLALPYGHMPFEKVVENVDGLFRIRKLAAIMPDTIQEIALSQSGGLDWIKQNTVPQPPEIPINKMIWFSWDKEGYNWVGRSILRALYKHWLIKDRLLRVDAINHERSGAGVPIVEAPLGATPSQIRKLDLMAQKFKVGEHAGGAVPSGTKFTLKGVEGTQPNTLGSIRYHDEQMARSLLQMVIQLGQTKTGSRSLGETFTDMFANALDTVAEWYCSIVNEHLIEDWVDWNFGREQAAPLLTFERNEDPYASVTDMVQMVQAGLLVVDENLEHEIRERYNFPEKAEVKEGEEEESKPSTAPGGDDDESVEDRQTHEPNPSDKVTNQVIPSLTSHLKPDWARALTTIEVTSQTDFRELDRQWQNAIDEALVVWATVRKNQIDDLHDQIVSAKNKHKKLAALKPLIQGSDELWSILNRIADEGAMSAYNEAIRQGQDAGQVSLAAIRDELRASAEAAATTLAADITTAAARHALGLISGTMSAKEVANEVSRRLNGLTEAFPKQELGGAITSAQNAGRVEFWKSQPAKRYYSSSVLDRNTCNPCRGKDNTNYDNLTDARREYPAGFVNCDGGKKCRCLIIAVHADEVEADR